jgi:MFS transporter, PPP family, 3-phenylpropionic acid transporter
LIRLGFVTLVSVFRAPVSPLADSLTAAMASRYLLDFGKMRLWGSITFTISAISLGAIWQLIGFQAMFAASAMFFIPTVFVALLLEEPKTDQVSIPASRLEEPNPIASPNLVESHIPSVKIKTRSSTRLRLAPGLLFLLASTFFMLAGLFMTGTFSSVYLSQLGGSTALIGAVMGVAALGEVPGMLFCIRIARRIGDTNILIASYGIVAIGMFGYTISTAPAAQLVFAALRGIGFGSVLVATVTIINSRAPLNQASTYQGILSAACWGLAPLLGGPIGGKIYQTFGPLAFFYTATFMVVIAMLLITPTYWFWKKSSGEK